MRATIIASASSRSALPARLVNAVSTTLLPSQLEEPPAVLVPDIAKEDILIDTGVELPPPTDPITGVRVADTSEGGPTPIPDIGTTGTIFKVSTSSFSSPIPTQGFEQIVFPVTSSSSSQSLKEDGVIEGIDLGGSGNGNSSRYVLGLPVLVGPSIEIGEPMAVPVSLRGIWPISLLLNREEKMPLQSLVFGREISKLERVYPVPLNAQTASPALGVVS
jgi:hypothetical protein